MERAGLSDTEISYPHPALHESVSEDYTTGPAHQLQFFKERFLAKDHPDRAKMERFSSMLRKLGLREETNGYGPTKEKGEACNPDSH